MVADALSRAPLTDTTQSTPTKALLISRDSRNPALQQVQDEHRSDHDLAQLIDFLQAKKLPDDPEVAKRITAQSRKGYCVIDGILFYEGVDMPDRRRLVVPRHLQQKVMEEHHNNPYPGHFAVKRMNK